MTIDLSTLEAGDTYEIACGGRIVTSGINIEGAAYHVSFDGRFLTYLRDGSYSPVRKTALDIIAIHKKPKPVEFVEYRNVYKTYMSDAYQHLPDAERGAKDGLVMIVKHTLRPETKEVFVEVVKK